MRLWFNWIRNNRKIASGIIFLCFAIFLGFNFKNKYNSVERSPLKRGDLTTAIYGSAQLKTDRSFDLKIGTSAKILELRKSIGSKVNKGDLIVIFDNLPSFKSPLDGVITALNFKNGETVFAQSTVLSIVDPKDFYLEMSLDQKSIRLVRPGQSARISFDGYRDLQIDGVVSSTFSNNGLFYGIIKLQNADPSFLSGMSADISIVTETKKDVLLAPLGAIKDGKILIEKNYKLSEVNVAVGVDDGAFAEILGENIQAGDIAILRSSMPTSSKFNGKAGGE
jgi:multidrug efflux pump subunit AcrA (membrane-fusion protein)